MPKSPEHDPVGFLSYVHFDDEANEGKLTQFRSRLEGEIRVQTGQKFIIFQDRRDVRWGDEWKRRIESSIDATAFLIPVITPSFFRSEQCRAELERFLARETRLARSDLIFPVYYVKCLDDSLIDRDPLAAVIAQRHYTDWCELRFETFRSARVGRRLAELARQLSTALASRPAVAVEPKPTERPHVTDAAAESVRAGPVDRYLDRLAPDAAFSSDKLSDFRSRMRLEAISDKPSELTATEFLRRAALIRGPSLTYTAVLLFGEDPTIVLPSAIVQCVRFYGTMKSDNLESTEIRATVPEMIVKTRDFVANLASIGESASSDGAYAEATYRYPMIAVREIIANAVVHRDYEVQDACVQVHVFTDRIEITSPGGWSAADLPDSQYLLGQLSQLSEHSRRRNFQLAQILTWSKLVEGVGAGLPRTLKDCMAAGAPEPLVTIGDGTVTVTIYPCERGGDTDPGLESFAAWPGDPAGSNPRNPLFFLSYAQASEVIAGDRRPHDRDRLTRRFFNDLSANVADLVGRPVGADPGFIDRFVSGGARWRDELLEALGTSEAFIGLLSAPYFDSSWCGMEWQAFAQRGIVRRPGVKSPKSRQDGIFPVIWAPVPDDIIPTAVRSVKRFEPRPPGSGSIADEYRSLGVLGLLRTGRTIAYQTVVWELAKEIASFHYDYLVEPKVLRESDLIDVFHDL